ncbi:GGDEF domain-containing protein [Alishewanella sp. SMS8]|uniref:GGDEF domain-containing protein n=1 Tax=Alishewanella sp. SMS8 TaxID=2994676 RepID=UPI0027411880|nr:GGDEF domain-containing protein [Alishewanella sp. SMS8]MDP5034772.1 diguanylate cyclase [Alishewanella sp.]MDP5187167.1 diguanylate cyclase [Alishewanella sp.]MDP5458454.1 diguanylate cyclase [Alishewanella sp. SMS8]
MAALQQDLKQQLSQAVSARKTLEQTYQKQFSLLSQLVLRLSLLTKGIDLELDNRLAKLRSALSKSADLENVLPLINDISSSLQALEKQQELEIVKIQQELTQAGKMLQQQRGLPDQLRRDLRQLLSKVEQPTATLQAFLPQLTHLAQLYQTALSAHQDAKNSNVLSDGHDEHERYAHVCRQLTLELSNLLSELTFTEKHAPAAEQIKASLLGSLTIEDLFNACLTTINIIANGLQEERQSSENFLLKLNAALASVQQAVEATLLDSGHFQQKLATLNQKIENQIDDLGKQTKKAQSLEQLKSLVIVRMNDLTESLNEKERLEQQERKKLLGSLVVMESRVKELERDAKSFKERLAEQSIRSARDTLTGIPNRAAYEARLDLEFKRWLRQGTPLCIILGDVDFFKKINDSYGHSAGDKTLRVIAKILQQSIRQTDFLARYGGEEFVIIMPDTKLSQTSEPLNLIREKIKKIPFKFKNEHVRITISFGATEFLAGEQPRQAFDRADEALYLAKKGGRDQIALK